MQTHVYRAIVSFIWQGFAQFRSETHQTQMHGKKVGISEKNGINLLYLLNMIEMMFRFM